MRDDEKYLNEHHSITETAIGIARLRLQEGCADAAMYVLDKCCDDLNEIIIKYQPATARMMELTTKSEVTGKQQ